MSLTCWRTYNYSKHKLPSKGDLKWETGKYRGIRQVCCNWRSGEEPGSCGIMHVRVVAVLVFLGEECCPSC
jgi:hypothetical protein